MPSQGVFSNTPPAQGEVRVLVQTELGSGFQTIRSVVISDTDKNGKKIIPSLKEVKKVILPISSSAENSVLTVNSITPKSGYFYLDTNDIILSGTANSLNSEIAVDPFLIEPFNNNQYNALLSNAESTRENFLRYDIDRTTGGVFPDNYNAIAGNRQVNLTLYHEALGVASAESSVPSGTTVNPINTIYSPVKSIQLNQDVNVIFTLADIDNTFDIPVPTVARVAPSALITQSYYVILTTTLTMEMDTVDTFDSANLQTATILTQTYVTGDTSTSKSPFKETFLKTQGDDLYFRLKQSTNLTSFANSNHIIEIGTFFGELDRYLNLFITNLESQIPYAQKAPVQDSNYTDTGLINARYEGTKTSETDFSGISPAVNAVSFEAAVYPYTEDANTLNNICSASMESREIENLLFNGSGTQPLTGKQTVGIIGPVDYLSTQTDQQVRFIPIYGSLVTPGDVLQIQSGSNEEMVQVLNILSGRNINTGTREQTLILKRNFDNQGAATFNQKAKFNRIGGDRIFTLTGNRLKPIGKRTVWLKETGTIVTTNDKGYVDEIKLVCSVNSGQNAQN